MAALKILAIALLALGSTQAVAGEIDKPSDRGMVWTTAGPTLLSSTATDVTSHPDKYFGLAKADALAFIGSDGEIRSAQFEQAVRYYRDTYSTPLMSDIQLAQAIATAF
ncbi:DUF2388 domain-containing protein [Pseudomonas caspiana]|uniref:Holliday junction resolvase n=1 Tax=Pseudomonas caspiana TaxID=1451454 RepID=A0A1Y3P733_9PSED|nr:DUF2388 domain-containing protein [Pseudomonas caspiana]OUM75637.1 Holliday junction resolvase [Pseudomonas caspiana]